jgi:hypothetical protein
MRRLGHKLSTRYPWVKNHGPAEPVDQAGQRGRHGDHQTADERQPPSGRQVVLADTEGREDAERRRAGVEPDGDVGQRRMKRMPGRPLTR